MLKIIVGYIVLGRIVNWSVVGFSIWLLIRKCDAHDGVLEQLVEKYHRSPDAPVRESESMSKTEKLRVTTVNLLLWPRKVALLIWLFHCELRDADALIRAKAIAALYPES